MGLLNRSDDDVFELCAVLDPCLLRIYPKMATITSLK